ncbi:Ring finger domain family protein [Clavispora lusitaniae]|uniref:RING-type domain-containing protein n=1 Tax=Clavispora lusitaniae (strain ATCC 42720) TaxID=306902 RepID=C4Y887_CLAL4|nr:uncharacterized protein CLUG_04415 [Clavispora lusitaniae ATCC 42720]EEQ40287.1 hypothetical protein CLUG_04415 [Clavispora lusitaniae ATCC 42720]KAF7581776.1 Ring finger domain family protein [Clavispora lusitaniae]
MSGRPSSSPAESSAAYGSEHETVPDTTTESTQAQASSSGNAAPNNVDITNTAANTTAATNTSADTNTEGEAPSSDSDHSDRPNTEASANLFDRLLDTVLGQYQNAGGGSATSDNESSTTTPAATSTVNSDNSAIIITVNYMFLDGSDQVNPGRTGSLVVTLPNNATNREPRIISQFISLATRMAYSALSSAPKPHSGITLDKFRSLEVLHMDEVRDATCAICFESYESPKKAMADVDTMPSAKRRKLSPEISEQTAGTNVEANTNTGSSTSSATERAANTETNSNAESTDGNTNTDAETGASPADQTASDASAPTPQYLCQHSGEFPHLPLRMPCGHVFGQSCLAYWLRENTSCPLCRVSIGEPEPETPSVIPISYIRLGGLGEAAESADDTANSNDSADGILRRSTRVIFNSDRPRHNEAPPPPISPSAEERPRNSSISPVIDNIINYFSRARRQREENSGSPLFATGVASRRTPSGVETVTSDSASGDSFEHFTSLVGDLRGEVRPRSQNSDSSEGSGNPEQTEQTDENAQ